MTVFIIEDYTNNCSYPCVFENIFSISRAQILVEFKTRLEEDILMRKIKLSTNEFTDQIFIDGELSDYKVKELEPCEE